ncbi:TCF3 fusion partner homolog [Drosophila innubila]|uniref:TCF3 fusion partner homolog n=1 Tax=Drosophila innubila TaxID=198719 RepID=UPI00148E87A6|nr:TCF3 fusion partner homolog [Drosophila innubila]
MTLIKKSQLYKLLVEKMYNRCQQIQAENERSVMRVNGIKKLLRRRTYDVELLKRRLDKHGDNWRSVPMVAPQPKGKPEQKRRGPKPKNKQANTDGTNEAQQTVTRKPRKQRAKKQQTEVNAALAIPQQQQQHLQIA